MIAISKMAAAVQPSATLAAGAKAKQMKAEGITVYDFSLGEPDFATPEHICAAAVRAMQKGHTRYTPASGMPELRGAVARSYQKIYGLTYTPEQVVVSNGAKHSLHNALAATVGPGDEVIIATPYWVSYSDLVQMTGASSVLVPTKMETGFKMTPEQLCAAVTPRSRLLMLNSPSNPTGTVYTRRELEALADVVLETNLTVLSDEIYERLVFGNAKATCFATLRPGLVERTLTVSGASKTYAMTGWRVGWTLGPAPVIKAMANIQSQQTGCPCSVSQCAARSGAGGRSGMRRTHAPRVRGAARFGVRPAEKAVGREKLRAGRRVLCVLRRVGPLRPNPGRALRYRLDELLSGRAGMCPCQRGPSAAFGSEGYVRMSYAASREQLQAGLDRLEQFLR